MLTFLFLNKWRRVRLIGPCVSAALGCMVFAEALAQSAPTVANDGQTTSNPAAPKQNAGGPLASESTSQSPTYLGDVQPIFMGNCARCHNQQSRFVYNWLDYKTAYTDRWEIKRRVWDSWKGSYYKEAMPIENSLESLALTDDQRLTIKNWVENGGIQGEARAQAQGSAPQSKDERIAIGKRLFIACAACHQPTGKGLPNVFPPLAGSDFLNADKNRAIKIIIYGRQGEVVVNGMKFNNSMPPFPLSDQDIANVLTYVYNSFGNSGLEVTPEEVKSQRTQ
jgi:mono/diheme cytochrome c family protein